MAAFKIKSHIHNRNVLPTHDDCYRTVERFTVPPGIEIRSGHGLSAFRAYKVWFKGLMHPDRLLLATADAGKLRTVHVRPMINHHHEVDVVGSGNQLRLLCRSCGSPEKNIEVEVLERTLCDTLLIAPESDGQAP